jgi:hypothetical protein
MILFTGLIMFSGCVGDTYIDTFIDDPGHENESISSGSMNEPVSTGKGKTTVSLVQVVQNESLSIEM